MNYYNVLLAKKTNRVLQFGSLYERLFETWINRAKQILKDLPTGSISTVNDAAELPLNALKVSVEAWQEGTGDPSPSNIRPIHGWDSGEIGVVAKNLFDKNNINEFQGFIETGTHQFTAINLYSCVYIACKPNKTYTISKIAGKTFRIADSEFMPNNGVTYLTSEANHQGTSITFVTSNNARYLVVLYWSSANGDTLTPQEIRDTLQIELGTTPTTYEPYQGKQYTLDFPRTIYGAEWDVVGGELKQTDGYIASYNGESLPSTWISDRDVYASGTTPTTGAEVVYKLATPTTINLSPLSIRMLQGVNNVYADCGEVLSGKYWANV